MYIKLTSFCKLRTTETYLNENSIKRRRNESSEEPEHCVHIRSYGIRFGSNDVSPLRLLDQRLEEFV